MQRSDPWRAAILLIALSAPASAQVIWDMPHIIVPPPKFDNSVVRRSDAWPRLDPGAVLCRTEDDLARLAARRRGEQVATPQCQIIHTPTAITIERRAGPGRTQVSVTDQAGLDGWTDAWLPDRPQPVGGKGVQIK